MTDPSNLPGRSAAPAERGRMAAVLRLQERPGQAGQRMLRLLLAGALGLGALAVWSESQAQAAADGRAGTSAAERREAAAAALEGRRGQLDDKGQDYQANALQRCARLPADQRGDCETRARGEGQASGSVSGGGIIRKSVTTTVTPAAPAAGATDAETGTGVQGRTRDLAPLPAPHASPPVPQPAAPPAPPAPPAPAPAVRGSGS